MLVSGRALALHAKGFRFNPQYQKKDREKGGGERKGREEKRGELQRVPVKTTHPSLVTFQEREPIDY